MSILNCLPDRCSIYRRKRTKASGGDGTPLEVFELVSSSVECFSQPMGASEQGEYQQRGQTVNRNFFFNADPSLTVSMVIVLTSRDGTVLTDGNRPVFDVVSVPQSDASLDRGLAWSAICNYLSQDVGTEGTLVLG